MGSIPGTLRTAPERDSSPRKAALGETGGSWPPAEGKGEAAVLHRRAHPVPGFLHSRVGEPHDLKIG